MLPIRFLKSRKIGRSKCWELWIAQMVLQQLHCSFLCIISLVQ